MTIQLQANMTVLSRKTYVIRMKADARQIYIQQVVAPKGIDISRPTIVVMPNHIGFAQLFSHGTESAAKALWDKINY